MTTPSHFDFDPLALPVRFSHLKEMRRSPAHYRYAIEHARVDTPALRLGRIVHACVLGGADSIVVYDGERRGAAWKDFAAAHHTGDLVTRAEWERAKPIVAAVQSDPIAARYLDGEREIRIDWEIAGRACQSRLDAIRPGSFVAELKTTTRAGVIDLQRHSWRMGYHAQLSYYQHAAKHAGMAVSEAYLVAIEVTPPHPVTVLRLSESVLAEGEKCWRAWWETLRVCETSNQWPGYVQDVASWDVPEWIETDSDDGDDDGDDDGEDGD